MNKDNLGRALFKDRFTNPKSRKDKKHKKIRSVIEEGTFAHLALNHELENLSEEPTIKIFNKDREGLENAEDIEELRKKYEKLLYIPKRPENARLMSKEDLYKAERKNYITWRQDLAEIEKDSRVEITPFECNLEFWRQLWRVIERSDILIQVVDARNPLLYRNDGFERYVNEVDSKKINMLLMNKSDYLTEEQRMHWARYFVEQNIRVVFWSAKIAEESNKITLNTIEESQHEEKSNKTESISNELDKDYESYDNLTNSDGDIIEESQHEEKSNKTESISDELDKDYESYDNLTNSESDSDIESKDVKGKFINSEVANAVDNEKIKKSSEILNINELIELLENIDVETPMEEGKVTVGLIGYPNVGKSSTINAIYGRKKASVSTTPGHTKIFQTLNITEKLTFCDCPGLVMPSVVRSKAELLNAGILPIDKTKNFIPSVNIIASQFPRSTLEGLYGLELPAVPYSEDQNRHPTAREFLSSFAFCHGMMGGKGVPNMDKAARIVLKDYTNGKLLYCYPPPNIDPITFKSAAPLPKEKAKKLEQRGLEKKEAVEPDIPLTNISSSGFGIIRPKCMVKKPVSETNGIPSNNEVQKPWRVKNKVKKDKLRRMYRHLDVHAEVYD